MFAMSQSAYFPLVLLRNSFAWNLVIAGLSCSGADLCFLVNMCIFRSNSQVKNLLKIAYRCTVNVR